VAADDPAVPLPEGYHSVNPYIVVDDVEPLIEFLAVVFGGREQGTRERAPDGRIGHADVRIGDSLVMISASSDAYAARPTVLFVYVDDVDATYRAALAAGARAIVEPTEQPWGDRVGGFHDPFDNRWWVATHLREFA
jgi:PhnB protein